MDPIPDPELKALWQLPHWNCYRISSGRLNYRALGHLCAAVRGPDCEYPVEARELGQELKHHITARFRAILFEDYPGDANFEPMKQDEFELLQARLESYVTYRPDFQGSDRMKWRKGGLQHYIEHLAYALEVVEGHPIWNGLGKTIKNHLYQVS